MSRKGKGRRKKSFPCGHRGFGSYCHACKDPYSYTIPSSRDRDYDGLGRRRNRSSDYWL